MWARLFIAVCVAGFAALPLRAEAAETYVRVVDSGGGVCVVARTPAGATFVFDAGDRPTTGCAVAIRELIPEHTIDLLVINRTETGALDDLPNILSENTVRQIVHPGAAAIDALVAGEGAQVVHATAGQTIALGDVRVTLIGAWRDAGAYRAPDEPTPPRLFIPDPSGMMARLEFANHSVLITSGTMGLKYPQQAQSCFYAERIAVANAAQAPLASDVLVGQASYASYSNCFSAAVHPTFVVFTEGQLRGYARTTARSPFERLRDAGVERRNMFTTDFSECFQLNTPLDETYVPCRDQTRDDDVEIWLPDAGDVRVAYRRPRFVRDAQ